jgi:hypothetical protein
MRRHRRRDGLMPGPIGNAAVVFQPGHFTSVGAQILAADVVALAHFRAMKAKEAARTYTNGPKC